MNKLDFKQVLAKGAKFVDELKAHPKAVPFLDFDDLSKNGLMDFRFVNIRIVGFDHIEKNFRENRYSTLEQITGDLCAVFEAVSNYVPLTDPLQQDVNYFLGEIDKFRRVCQGENPEQSVQTRSGAAALGKKKPIQKFEVGSKDVHSSSHRKFHKHYERQRQTKMKNYAKIEEEGRNEQMATINSYKLPVRSTLAQKIEMVYFLKARETNEPFITMIGDMYQIGQQTKDEYTIKLDNSTNCMWLDILKDDNEASQVAQETA